MTLMFGPRRGTYVDILEDMKATAEPLAADELQHFQTLDLIYRSLCALLFNYVPLSGHPGGSISSGRLVAGLIFDAMDYDASDPQRDDADVISFAAGHKAMGLYAMWALRNEVMRIAAPELVPGNQALQLRLEDLLGFRRNPITRTPLFLEFGAKPLDGHPTPATPFVRLSTGAAGVGVSTSLGLAFGALDYYGTDAPRVHVVEGEGGMTPGRVSEAMAAAGTASLNNAIVHVDWNQASIDSDHVCRDGTEPGDYVQWNPLEFAYLHDWNVILVPDGANLQQILAAQRKAVAMETTQPTAIVYRTTKGWLYGIEGKTSHGAGHKLCDAGFYEALEPLLGTTDAPFPRCDPGDPPCRAGVESDALERCFWGALQFIRTVIEENRPMVDALAQRLRLAHERLNERQRRPRPEAPAVDAIFATANEAGATIPEALALAPGKTTTLRGELGRVLQHYNEASGGAILSASADLLGSTSLISAAGGFPAGYYNAATNPGARLLSIGGICEDAMAGILSGISTYGHHIGVGSSYSAFIAALGHVPARLHAIGNQARQAMTEGPYRPFFLICAHAGVKTGEDGPTHADPQALQLLEGNFPDGTMITLTPWDPQEIWFLVSTALASRPAVIAPFVTRPTETILNRHALDLAPAADARFGLYLLRPARDRSEGTVVLQGSEVAYAFIEDALPLLEREGIDVDAYYVASAELFDLLAPAEQQRIFPDSLAEEAMGITGFTLPTMYRWIRSELGRASTLHPLQKGHYLGSGQADKVMIEAGLDGANQFEAIVRYVKERR